MNTMTSKGFTGYFEFIPGDDGFHDRVIGIRDVIHFSGGSVGVANRQDQPGYLKIQFV